MLILSLVSITTLYANDIADGIADRFGFKRGSPEHQRLVQQINKIHDSGWAEQEEKQRIMRQIASINERFSAVGAYHSSARKGAIAQLLKQIGTPTAHKIHQEMLASGAL